LAVCYAVACLYAYVYAHTWVHVSWHCALEFLPARRCASAGRPILAVALSVTSRCSIETDERIELVVSCMGASFNLPYTVFYGKSNTHNEGTFLWNFAPNSGLIKFRQCISIVEMCYKLSWTKVDAQLTIATSTASLSQ